MMYASRIANLEIVCQDSTCEACLQAYVMKCDCSLEFWSRPVCMCRFQVFCNICHVCKSCVHSCGIHLLTPTVSSRSENMSHQGMPVCLIFLMCTCIRKITTCIILNPLILKMGKVLSSRFEMASVLMEGSSNESLHAMPEMQALIFGCGAQ